jgi:hypothetical protein
MAQMKLDLNKQLMQLDGNPAENTMAKLLAADLVQGTDGPAIKLLDWAFALWKSGIIEIDNADLQMLKAQIENSPRLTVLAKGQLLKELIKP